MLIWDFKHVTRNINQWLRDSLRKNIKSAIVTLDKEYNHIEACFLASLQLSEMVLVYKRKDQSVIPDMI